MPLISTSSPHRRNAFRISAPAFTIIEIIVVVTILIALVAILIPAVGAARKSGNKAANTAQLSSIQSGLQQYHQDFNLYPPSTPLVQPANTTPGYTTILAGRGPAMLAEALMGYLNSNTPGSTDGAGTLVNPTDPRFGFRTRAGGLGKIYGPYASDNPKGFKVNLSDSATPPNPTDAAFIDIFGHEILYFASSQQGVNGQTTTVPITSIFGVSATPINPATVSYYFDRNDCTTYYPSGSTTTSPLKESDGSTNAPLPTDPLYNPPTVNVGPTKIFFQNLAGRSSNLLSSGSGPVMGADSFLLISIGEDNNPYTDDDILATNR